VNPQTPPQRLPSRSSPPCPASRASHQSRTEAAVDEANELLDRALAEEVLADSADTAASDAATSAGVSSSLGASALAKRARDHAGEAKGLVADDNTRAARLLKDRCDDIRNNARALLAEFQ
jgi:hypothetical protein